MEKCVETEGDEGEKLQQRNAGKWQRMHRGMNEHSNFAIMMNV